MATRKPATSTLLKKAQEDIAKLQKELESSKSSMKYYQDIQARQKTELDDIHSFFDSIPGVIPRRNEETYNERAAMTRMAQWLATK